MTTPTDNDMVPVDLSRDIMNYFASYYQAYGFGLNVQPKSSSKLMKAIGTLFSVTRISPEFMTKYITTIGDTVYVPDAMLQNQDENLLRVLQHESVHVYDTHRLSSPVFRFLYLFPQILAPLALLSFLAFWKVGFLWCLLFLLGLAPIPAPGRYWLELRAYRTTVLACRLVDGRTVPQMSPVYSWIEKQFTTSLYYWTWPFAKMVEKDLMNESWMSEGIYKFIYNWHATRKQGTYRPS